MSEQQIQNRIFTLISKRFTNAGTEISVLNRCVDIVYLNNKRELVTIEIKLKDWKKAIEQASDHQLYADRSYICLPEPRRNISHKLLNALRGSGIGLLLFKFEKDRDQIQYEEFIKARRNSFCWTSARRKIESIL